MTVWEEHTSPPAFTSHPQTFPSPSTHPHTSLTQFTLHLLLLPSPPLSFRLPSPSTQLHTSLTQFTLYPLLLPSPLLTPSHLLTFVLTSYFQPPSVPPPPPPHISSPLPSLFTCFCSPPAYLPLPCRLRSHTSLSLPLNRPSPYIPTQILFPFIPYPFSLCKGRGKHLGW